MRITMATAAARAGEPNEDFAAAAVNGVVLLDGAGLSGITSKCSHGVAWYARHLGGALAAGLPDESQNLKDILAGGIAETAHLHASTCQLDEPGTPSSTVVMVRIAGDRLQYLVLADSSLVLDLLGSEPEVITDNREALTGAAYRAEMDRQPNDTVEHTEARRAYVEALLAHRNRPGGFWVAAADPNVADQAIAGDRPLDDVRQVCLLSDGASRLADRFHLATWRQMLTALEGHGPEEVIRQVRAAEASDPLGRRWPRGKSTDDATVVWCTDLE
jgi:Protein phosphatase 2C